MFENPKDMQTPIDLQNGLNILENYCQRWKLRVNIEETKIMVWKREVNE